MTNSLWKKSLPYRMIFLMCILIISIISLIISSKHPSKCYLDYYYKPFAILDPMKWLIYYGSYGITGTFLSLIFQLCNKYNLSMVIQIMYIMFFEVWGIIGLALYISVVKCTIDDGQIIMLLFNVIVFVVINCIVIIWWLIYLWVNNRLKLNKITIK